jgi:hypothetical protein
MGHNESLSKHMSQEKALENGNYPKNLPNFEKKVTNPLKNKISCSLNQKEENQTLQNGKSKIEINSQMSEIGQRPCHISAVPGCRGYTIKKKNHICVYSDVLRCIYEIKIDDQMNIGNLKQLLSNRVKTTSSYIQLYLQDELLDDDDILIREAGIDEFSLLHFAVESSETQFENEDSPQRIPSSTNLKGIKSLNYPKNEKASPNIESSKKIENEEKKPNKLELLFQEDEDILFIHEVLERNKTNIEKSQKEILEIKKAPLKNKRLSVHSNKREKYLLTPTQHQKLNKNPNSSTHDSNLKNGSERKKRDKNKSSININEESLKINARFLSNIKKPKKRKDELERDSIIDPFILPAFPNNINNMGSNLNCIKNVNARNGYNSISQIQCPYSYGANYGNTSQSHNAATPVSISNRNKIWQTNEYSFLNAYSKHDLESPLQINNSIHSTPLQLWSSALNSTSSKPNPKTQSVLLGNSHDSRFEFNKNPNVSAPFHACFFSKTQKDASSSRIIERSDTEKTEKKNGNDSGFCVNRNLKLNKTSGVLDGENLKKPKFKPNMSACFEKTHHLKNLNTNNPQLKTVNNKNKAGSLFLNKRRSENISSIISTTSSFTRTNQLKNMSLQHTLHLKNNEDDESCLKKKTPFDIDFSKYAIPDIRTKSNHNSKSLKS